jgi:hypothetical protein
MAEIGVDFLQGPGISSRLISWFGQGPNGWSHCASVGMFKPFPKERYIDARNDPIAGVPAGVHIREPSTEKWIRKRRASLQVTQDEFDAWEASLRAKITTSYDRDAILGFLEGKSMHTAGRWICSALAINAVQHIGKVPYPLPVASHQITPNACLLILATAGFTIGPVQIA